MKIRVINLDRSPERLEFMRNQLDGMGLSFIRVAAVDGQLLRETEFDPAGVHSTEAACFLSQKRAWEQLVESADDYTVVLEDDALLGSTFPDLVSSTAWIPDEAKIIKLETARRKKRVVLSRKNYDAPAGHKVSRLWTNHLSAAGYIIRRDEAERLLALSIDKPVDVALFGKPALEHPEASTFQVYPAPIIQEARFARESQIAFKSLIMKRSKIGKERKNMPVQAKIRREIQAISSRLINIAGYSTGLSDKRMIAIGFAE